MGKVRKSRIHFFELYQRFKSPRIFLSRVQWSRRNVRHGGWHRRQWLHSTTHRKTSRRFTSSIRRHRPGRNGQNFSTKVRRSRNEPRKNNQDEKWHVVFGHRANRRIDERRSVEKKRYTIKCLHHPFLLSVGFADKEFLIARKCTNKI